MNSLTITLLYIYFVITLIALPFFLKTKVFSQLNAITNEENKLIEYNKNRYRIIAAKDYLNSLNISNRLWHISKLQRKELEHLIVVIATNKNYSSNNNSKLTLTQLVTQVDKNIKQEKVMKTGMIICNQREKYNSEMDSLLKYYPVFVETKDEQKRGKRLNPEETQRRDFVECAQIALQKIPAQPRYITVVRDVLVPYSSFLDKLHYLLKMKLERSMVRGELLPSNESWLFLHLQEPVPFRSFGFNWESIRELLLVAAAGAIIFYITGHILKITKSTRSSSLIFTIYGAFFFLTLAVILGRPYLTELRRNMDSLQTFYPQPSAVIVSAVTMPRESVTLMVDYLNKIKCSLYVTFPDVWDHAVTSLNKPGYVTSPSLMRYISQD